MQFINTMKIRKANISDLSNIMEMYKSCVQGMIKNDIDQWDKSYPNSEVITNDLENTTYYVATINKEIIGGINIDQIQDNTYLDIDWQDKTNAFLVVHRLAVKEAFWNKKIGKELMLFAENLVTEKNMRSIRLDTYSGNAKAMEFYKRLGYRKLGAINLKPEKNEYYCFEKIIQ
tara:strand:- start:1599 stop:2120 length:522 start_codon:yes stop_codon:yes gene_type:complete